MIQLYCYLKEAVMEQLYKCAVEMDSAWHDALGCDGTYHIGNISPKLILSLMSLIRFSDPDIAFCCTGKDILNIFSELCSSFPEKPVRAIADTVLRYRDDILTASDSEWNAFCDFISNKG